MYACSLLDQNKKLIIYDGNSNSVNCRYHTCIRFFKMATWKLIKKRIRADLKICCENKELKPLINFSTINVRRCFYLWLAIEHVRIFEGFGLCVWKTFQNSSRTSLINDFIQWLILAYSVDSNHWIIKNMWNTN